MQCIACFSPKSNKTKTADSAKSADSAGTSQKHKDSSQKEEEKTNKTSQNSKPPDNDMQISSQPSTNQKPGNIPPLSPSSVFSING